jgi:hypothetical protein
MIFRTNSRRLRNIWRLKPPSRFHPDSNILDLEQRLEYVKTLYANLTMNGSEKYLYIITQAINGDASG